MKILKSRPLRIISFIILAALSFCVLYTLQSTITEHQRLTQYKYDMLLGISEEAYSDYAKIKNDLWLLGNMYFRKLDKNGKLQCNSIQEKYIIENLKEARLMDSDENIIFPESKYFTYSLTAANYKYESPEGEKSRFSDDFTFIWQDNNITDYHNIYGTHYYGMLWYDNNNGMEYYLTDTKGYSVYSYDTTGLDSHVDDFGAVIFLMKDGRSPVPYAFNTQPHKYDSYDAVLNSDGSISEKTNSLVYKSECKGFSVTIRPVDSIIEKFIHNENILSSSEDNIYKATGNMIPFIAAIAVLCVYFLIFGGFSTKEKKFVCPKICRIWTELYVIVGCFTGYMFLSFFSEHVSIGYNLPLSDTGYDIVNASVQTLAFILTLECINAVIIKIKSRHLKDTTLITILAVKLINAYKKLCARSNGTSINTQNIFLKHFIIKTAVLIIAELAITITALSFDGPVIVFLAVPAVIIYAVFEIYDLNELSRISERLDRISAGDYSKEEAPKDSIIYAMSEKLNTISDGIENAIETKTRSEKMKVELVTNVSHDLKTPLTSIVSFVDLLSGEELSPVAADYVNIIKQKTDVLKNIVSDVFDIAKATSKTDINMEQIDAVVLVNQVVGDMQGVIDSAENKLCTSLEINSAKIFADGKKMYRALQNIIDNALKYSLKGTRIFLDMYRQGEKVVIKLRNTASYEMNFTADEITERFKRADQSRNSEGSGLGLSIAKSFTEACGGSFDIIIDGDIFNVVIAFDITEA